ncbi:MAG: S46 family peptidase [Burkholderiales bacterium]|nr:S46 family peptidase [Bacteroidia bacterium]
MKKIVLSLIIFSFILKPVAKADEGMWLPMLLGEQVYADMVKKGLKVSKEQLYSMNQACIKDAIIIFGGGCTGEIVSKEGLIFTNHHCGYSAIAAASSVDHNYLKDGFWSKSKSEEIYAPGVHAQFLIKIVDMTDKVNERIKDIPALELTQKLPGILVEMANKETEGTIYEGRVASMFKANQFLLFVYERYKDVRLVGTPPESIGKFGGDTDNWEWPRHTGDFSIFRVYTNKEGKAADYAADNIPLKAKYSLPVSIKGVKDGDYTMIWGYPGGTNRYETSFGVKLKTDIENPSLVDLRDARLKFMLEEMKKDPAVKIQLAGYYAGVANYWKFFDGESKQLLKFKTYEEKQANEAAFLTWAKGNSEFENLFTDHQKVYDAWRPYAKQRVYMTEGIFGSPLIAFAGSLQRLDATLSKKDVTKEEITKVVEGVKTARATFIKSENLVSDKNILAFVTQAFYNDIDATQHPAGFYSMINTKFGDLKLKSSYEAFSKYVFDNTSFLDNSKWEAMIANPDTAALHKDPAFMVANAFNSNFNSRYSKLFTDFNTQNFLLGKSYMKGILEMNKGKKMYPDANFTMRVSFGNVKSYAPKDAVKYSHICTLSGILEKYKPGDYEFDAPKKLIELAKKKDYGQYMDADAKDIVVSFISSNDITGGNSGSPVINAKGELIGLAFDGNYEALSHKIKFDKDLNRTINLDVRYLLWVVEKVGGATNIINELDIKKM